MADAKLTALSAAGAFDDADLLYIVQGGTSYKTTWGAIKAAILLAKYPEVANFAALPAAADHSGETYVCLAAQGVYFVSRKPAGFYYSNGSSWAFVGDLPSDYFTDSILQIADDADPTKIAKFQLSSIATGTTRTFTLPNASGTVMLVGDAPATHATSHKSGGGDAIKLDELAAPDDTTTRDATASLHGLMPKADKAKLDKIYAAKADVASAGTIDLDAAASDLIEITGTTTITAITLAAGLNRVVRFQGASLLTHGASLILPGGANITPAAGDFAIFRGYAAGVVRCVSYVKASGKAVVTAVLAADLPALTGPVSTSAGAVATTMAVVIQLACSDVSTAITAGNGKITFRMPFAMTLTAVRASVNTAPTGSTIIIDINEGGTTVLSTKLSIDASEKTSTTAASAAVISDAALADDAEITIDFDQVGSTIAGAGVVVTLIGTRAA